MRMRIGMVGVRMMLMMGNPLGGNHLVCIVHSGHLVMMGVVMMMSGGSGGVMMSDCSLVRLRRIHWVLVAG